MLELGNLHSPDTDELLRLPDYFESVMRVFHQRIQDSKPLYAVTISVWRVSRLEFFISRN
jgi:hypothetical protein